MNLSPLISINIGIAKVDKKPAKKMGTPNLRGRKDAVQTETALKPVNHNNPRIVLNDPHEVRFSYIRSNTERIKLGSVFLVLSRTFGKQVPTPV